VSVNAGILTAIAQYKAANRTGLYFPAGTYLLSSPLTVPSGTVLVGAGMASSWLKGKINYGSTSSFTDLKIGPATAGLSSTQNVHNATGTSFTRCHFRGGGGTAPLYTGVTQNNWPCLNIGADFSGGMTGAAAYNLTFTDCEIERSLGTHNCVSLYAQRTGTIIDGVTFNGCHFGVSNGVASGSDRFMVECWTEHGMGWYWRNLTFQNCDFAAGDECGLDFACHNDSIRGQNVLVDGCTFHGARNGFAYGICSESADYITIRNNTFYRHYENHINLVSTNWPANNHAVVTGNVINAEISEIGALTPNRSGIYIAVDNAMVTGNTIRYSGIWAAAPVEIDTGVYTPLGGHNNIVTGNTFYHNASESPIISQASGCTGNTITPNTETHITPVVSGEIDLTPPDGYTFNGGGTYSTSGILELGSNCTIIGVNFTNSSRQIVIDGNNNTVQGCTFGPNNWSALIVECGSSNTIEGCTFNTTSGQGANIQVWGGGHNIIRNNTTKGGVTGIIHLAGRDAAGVSLAAITDGTEIYGNTCYGFTQEGISFDFNGDQEAKNIACETTTIVSVSGNNITLGAYTFPSYAGYDICFMTGALAGRTRSIAGQSGTGNRTFICTTTPTGAAPGDLVTIGGTYKNCHIHDNTVTAHSAAWPAINLYGMCYGNLVEDNTVLLGCIKVESVANTDIPNCSAIHDYSRAPCGYNTIRNNAVAHKVQLQYYAWPTSPDGLHANDFAATQTKGNNAIGNTCSAVEVNEQWCYVSGNSGATSDLGGNTFAGSEMT